MVLKRWTWIKKPLSFKPYREIRLARNKWCFFFFSYTLSAKGCVRFVEFLWFFLSTQAFCFTPKVPCLHEYLLGFCTDCICFAFSKQYNLDLKLFPVQELCRKKGLASYSQTQVESPLSARHSPPIPWTLDRSRITWHQWELALFTCIQLILKHCVEM